MFTDVLLVADLLVTVGAIAWVVRRLAPPAQSGRQSADTGFVVSPMSLPSYRDPFPHAGRFQVVREHDGGQVLLYPLNEGHVSGAEARRTYERYDPGHSGEAVIFRERVNGRWVERGRKCCPSA